MAAIIPDSSLLDPEFIARPPAVDGEKYGTDQVILAPAERESPDSSGSHISGHGDRSE